MFFLIASLIKALALGMGVCGYQDRGGLAWIDALVNAAMILGGMGPVEKMETVPGKLVSTFYALFSGLLFVATFSLLISPVMHRTLHKFHVDDEDLPKRQNASSESVSTAAQLLPTAVARLSSRTHQPPGDGS